MSTVSKGGPLTLVGPTDTLPKPETKVSNITDMLLVRVLVEVRVKLQSELML